MGWLLGQFGRERLQQSNIIVPTRQLFPEHYDGSEVAARALFNRTCVFMGTDPASVELVFHQPTHRPGLARSVARSRLDWAGQFQFGEGKNLVRVDVRLLPLPESLLTVFAHELAHHLLLGSGRICKRDPDHELVTDLSTAFFGMGVFNANDSLVNRFRLDRRGDEIGTLGYLTPTIWGYALALCAWLRNEEKPAWADWLRPAIRRVFRRSLGYLVRTGDAQVVDGGQLDVRGRVSALRTEYPLFALAADLESGETCSQDSEWNENTEAQVDLEQGPEAATSRVESVELLLAVSHHIEAGEWSEAHECLDAVIRFEPENGTAYQQRVWVLLELGMLVEALQDAELAVSLEPDDSESYRARGAACLKAGRFEQAVVDLTQYIAEEDTRTASGTRASRGYYMRGLAYAGLGDARKAIKDYGQAIRCWPDWPEPYEARAEAYELVGISARARADHDEARRRAAP
jgi:regulator of sirC expression with transglutaminase-like and TPR domain